MVGPEDTSVKMCGYLPKWKLTVIYKVYQLKSQGEHVHTYLYLSLHLVKIPHILFFFWSSVLE